MSRVGHPLAVTPDPKALVTGFSCYADRVTRSDDTAGPLVREVGLRRLGEQATAAVAQSLPGAMIPPLLCERAARQFRPLVSIVIPVYNGAHYLAEAIDSALAQTYDTFEVIVVNDGSTDDGATERVACSYGERIRYVSQPNGGVASALNRGVAEMRGDYFSWLSHDDIYTPDRLATQVAALTEQADPERCILYSDYSIFTDDPDAATPVAIRHYEPADFRYFITAYNELHGCTLLVPRQAFAEHGGFDPALRTTQDYDLWFRFATTYRCVHLPRVLVKARSHAGQDTLRFSDLVLAECNTLLRGFVERLSPAEVQHQGEYSLAAGYLALATNLNARGFRDAGARARQLYLLHLTDEEIIALLDHSVELRAQLDEERTRNAGLADQLAQERARNAGLTVGLTDADMRLAALRLELDAIYGSRSWALVTRLRRLYQRERRPR